jgi:hypothetical protein
LACCLCRTPALPRQALAHTCPLAQIRGDSGLLDAMENYLSSCNARLVIMGSMHITMNSGGWTPHTTNHDPFQPLRWAWQQFEVSP